MRGQVNHLSHYGHRQILFTPVGPHKWIPGKNLSRFTTIISPKIQEKIQQQFVNSLLTWWPVVELRVTYVMPWYRSILYGTQLEKHNPAANLGSSTAARSHQDTAWQSSGYTNNLFQQDPDEIAVPWEGQDAKWTHMWPAKAQVKHKILLEAAKKFWSSQGAFTCSQLSTVGLL